MPSIAQKVRGNRAAMPAGRCAAPLTPKGEPSAADSAAMARASSSPSDDERRRRPRRAGSTLNVDLGHQAERAMAPHYSFTRSRPVTFFITRPPHLTISPRPLTRRKPIRWSRAAPA